MYNRYIPENIPYIPVGEESTKPEKGRSDPCCESSTQGNGFRLPSFLFGSEGGGALLSGGGSGKSGLSGLLRTLKLEHIDSGDILLLLIILFLLAEGDDLELVIALGLVLLMGFGEWGKEG